MRTKTMLAGILITVGMGTFAYQGIASTGATRAVEAIHSPRVTAPAVPHEVRPLPMLGALLLFVGLALLIVEQTRTEPLFHGRRRYR